MRSNILLVGTVSNVAKTIEKELETVIKALDFFDKIEIFLVESDSSDNSVEILKRIQQGNKNFTFVTKGHLSNRYPNRIARIAYCRNIYVEFIKKNLDGVGGVLDDARQLGDSADWNDNIYIWISIQVFMYSR